jgi:hemerythrin-like domain-containing protein
MQTYRRLQNYGMAGHIRGDRDQEERREEMAREILAILKQEHEKVASQLDETMMRETSPMTPLNNQQFSMLEQELREHMEGEEKTFYPKLESQYGDLVGEALEEHDTIKTGLDGLSGSWSEEAEWKTKLEGLKHVIDHHVEEEEGRVFSAARELFSADELRDLGRQYETEKQRMMGGKTGAGMAETRI